jgi:hypothetical protein
MQVSFMLKEVEMTPCHLTGIVSRAAGATRRAAEAAAAWKVDADVEPARLRVKVAAHHFPGERKPQRHLKQLRIPHRSRLPPSRSEPIVPACSRLSMTLPRRFAVASGHP